MQRREKGSPYWVNAVHVPAKQTSATVPDLTEGQDYEFRIIATNVAGQSEPSEPSDVVTAKDRYREYMQARQAAARRLEVRHARRTAVSCGLA